MQFRRPPVLGVIYNTTLTRPDQALALAMLYGFQGRNDSKVASIAVTNNSLGAAAFADAVYRFYQGGGPMPNANQVLPIGFAADQSVSGDSPMVKAVFARRDDDGQPQYDTEMKRVSDTAEPTALMHHSLAYFEDNFIEAVLSAPATHLARVLDIQGAPELIKTKMKSLIVSDCKQDVPAMRRILADWPVDIIFCGKETGEALPYPGAAIAEDFTWTKAHPVADFYSAYKTMPYDTPSQDLVAVMYAIHPDTEGLSLSEPGTIAVNDDGTMSFTPAPDGKHKRIVVDPAKKDSLVLSFREIVGAKPPPRPGRRGPRRVANVQQQQAEEAAKAAAEKEAAAREAAAKAAADKAANQ